MKDNITKRVLTLVIIILFTGVGITPTLGTSNSIDDTTPPVTTISFYPETPDGANEWYVTTVTAWLDATDDMSGVNTTYYSINSGDWEIYDTSIILEDDSLYYITYFSVDNSGNMEFPKLANIKVDQTPPFVNITYKVIDHGPLGGWEFIFTAIAFDQISGMNRVDFFFNDVFQVSDMGSGPIYNWSITYCYPMNVIKAEAFDHAGNYVWGEIIDPKSILRFPIFDNFLLLRLIEHFPLLNLLLQRLRI